jgi:hypothetical protein
VPIHKCIFIVLKELQFKIVAAGPNEFVHKTQKDGLALD